MSYDLLWSKTVDNNDDIIDNNNDIIENNDDIIDKDHYHWVYISILAAVRGFLVQFYC